MGLTTGSRLGPYEIIAPLGAGGMGEVYRARDTRLGREVAIKVLSDSWAADTDRLRRFEQEAKFLASLNHPSIAALYGMEDFAGKPALVMELVAGPTLADRLVQGPISPDDAVLIARQLAEALEYAHDLGVVHRDLKPANIKLLPNGGVKVLDFGLAKALEPAKAADNSNILSSPTMTAAGTKMGIILGTAAYMSPEQAKGKSVDRRSDIFSFGCVVYEMVTGKMAFGGETVTDTLAAVVRGEPDWSAVPPQTSGRLRRLMERCLRKDVKSRLQAIGDARIALEETDDPPLTPDPAARWRRMVAPIALALAASVITAAVLWAMRSPTKPAAVTRFAVQLPPKMEFTGNARSMVAISPDGKMIAFSAGSPLMLYTRAMSDLEAKPVRGTDTANISPVGPLFSPDGKSLAYWTGNDQTIKVVPTDGGAPITVCQTEVPSGMTWSEEGLVFANTEGIQRVSPNGGKPELLVKIVPEETAFGPRLLPGGHAVLFAVAPISGVSERWERAKVVVQLLRTGQRKVLVDGGADARYLKPGYLTYVRGGVLYAVPFDADRLELTGKEAPVVEGVRRGTGTVGAATANYSISENGTLAWIPGPLTTLSTHLRPVLVDRVGKSEPLGLAPGPWGQPRVSPDGKHIAFESDDGKEANIWILDVGSDHVARRLTFGGNNRTPAWSADSQYVAFQSDRESDLGIFLQRADGTGTPQRLTMAAKNTEQQPLQYSPDGEYLLYDSTSSGRTTLWLFSVRERKAAQWKGIDSTQLTGATFSPNGRWIAYAAREPGARNMLFVEPFPQTGAKYQVSENGHDAHHPVWAPDGTELFYVPGPGTQLVHVPVKTAGTFSFGESSTIDAPFFNTAGSVERGFDLMRDGKRIVTFNEALDATGGGARTHEIDVVLNWYEELKAKAPADR